MQLTFMYNIVLLYVLIFLVADCVCGVVGTSFLVAVGQHKDSWVGSIKRHIGSIETRYTKTHVENSTYNTKLATKVAKDSIPTGDKPTIYDL